MAKKEDGKRTVFDMFGIYLFIGIKSLQIICYELTSTKKFCPTTRTFGWHMQSKPDNDPLSLYSRFWGLVVFVMF